MHLETIFKKGLYCGMFFPLLPFTFYKNPDAFSDFLFCRKTPFELNFYTIGNKKINIYIPRNYE